MTDLESVSLTSTHLRSGSNYSDWRVVLHAIRDYANSLHVEFDQIITNDAAETSIDHNTGSDCEWLLPELKDDEDYTFDEASDLVNDCIFLHISGKVDRNRPLRVQLDGEESE